MIVRVLEQARRADIGPVAVACDSEEIAAAVRDHGGQVVMTRSDHASGSDRINEAANVLDPDGAFDVILNVQGDVPLIAPEAIRAAFEPLAIPEVDIGTIMIERDDAEIRTNDTFVKAVVTPNGHGQHRALYFTRATAPSGEGSLFHHIGIYAYRRAALSKFVSLAPSPLELREKLEQLRALEAGMRIDASVIDSAPMDVNTPEDLEQAREAYRALEA